MSTFDQIAEKFTGQRKTTNKGVMVCCPAHEDHNPSLHLLRGDDAVGVMCFAGCDKRDVMDAVGLEWSDLFYQPRLEQEHGKKDLGADSLDMTYEYLRDDGTVYMTVERWYRADGSKTFKQRGPDGNYKLPRGFKPCLYNLPSVIPHCQNGGEVWIAEGEKDVQTLTHHGLVATTAPMGAGKWQRWYWRWLRGASGIVVVADNDEPGRKHAALVSRDLATHGFSVRVVRARRGKDATDHFRYGYGPVDFLPFNPDRVRPNGVTCSDLLGKSFAPITWSVPGILPSGLALLGGPPKRGKSFTAHDLALAVAGGRRSFLTAQANQGSVLYLALDNDSEQRLAERTRLILRQTEAPHDLPVEFHTDWPIGVDAVAACREWTKEVARPKMIVIDTLVKVEPDFDNPRFGAYGHSTDVLSRWAQLAIEADLTILAVHHDRKGGQIEDGDWIDRFTGSRGITATAATLLFLDVSRETGRGHLHMTGRDVGDFDMPVKRDDKVPLYMASELPHGALRYDIPDTVAEILDEQAQSAPVQDPFL